MKAAAVAMVLLVTIILFATARVVRALRHANRSADEFEDRFWSGGSLDELLDAEAASPASPMAAVFRTGMREWRKSIRAAGADIARSGVHERLERIMALSAGREMEQLEYWMILLTSVRTVAPFVGLVGTAWGFAAIAGTGMPIVTGAPIAATVGLVTALAAALVHDATSASLARFSGRLTGFAAEFGAILSRQSESGKMEGTDRWTTR